MTSESTSNTMSDTISDTIYEKTAIWTDAEINVRKNVWIVVEHDVWHYVWNDVISYPNFWLICRHRIIRPILRRFKRQILRPRRRKKRRRFWRQICQVGWRANFVSIESSKRIWQCGSDVDRIVMSSKDRDIESCFLRHI